MSLRATVPLALSFALGLTGCQVGSLEALGRGDWPITPRPTNPAPWAERGGGAGGVLVRTGPGRYRVVTSEGDERLAERGDLAGAQLSGAWLYRVVGEEVRRERWDDGELEHPRDDVLLVSGEGAVYVVTHDAGARAIWTGEALAVALDPARKLAWIAADAPLAVIDAVDLAATGEVRVRVPLPLELESPSLAFVVGPRGVVAYAHDRPVASALLIMPELGRAEPLRAREGVQPGRADAEALPTLIVPPGVVVDGSERLSLGGDPGDTFGRVALLPDGRFLAVEAGAEGVRLGAIAVPQAADAPLQVQALTRPDEWSGRVEAVGWDDAGAFVVSSRDIVRFGREPLPERVACRPDRRFGAAVGDAIRAGANHLLTAGVFVVEATTALSMNSLAASVAAVLGPIVFFFEPTVGLVMTSAPVWFPVAYTFGLWNF